MWRKAGAGEVYAYFPSSVEHGTSLERGKWTFPTDEWFEISQRVILNDPGKSNGKVEVKLNGKSVFFAENLTFRKTTKLKIDYLFFSTFFGGGDPSWATPVDTKIEFKDFVVRKL